MDAVDPPMVGRPKESLPATPGALGVPVKVGGTRPYNRRMTMISGAHDPRCSVDLAPAVALFRGLGDAARLGIVHELARGERRIVDLTGALGLAQSTVSAHVACLRDCALVEGRPVGRQMFYRLTRPELLSVLGAAEELLTATGNAVVLCPAYGHDVDGDARPAVGA
jgi:DNA-binding transcriptional ArsR family regulator